MSHQTSVMNVTKLRAHACPTIDNRGAVTIWIERSDSRIDREEICIALHMPVELAKQYADAINSVNYVVTIEKPPVHDQAMHDKTKVSMPLVQDKTEEHDMNRKYTVIQGPPGKFRAVRDHETPDVKDPNVDEIPF